MRGDISGNHSVPNGAADDRVVTRRDLGSMEGRPCGKEFVREEQRRPLTDAAGPGETRKGADPMAADVTCRRVGAHAAGAHGISG